MTKSDKERFSKRIIGDLIIWDYLKNDKDTTDIGEEVNITEPSLYERISEYAFLYGEDLQGMFKNDRYEYMSLFIRNVEKFRAEFENEELLKPLFNHGKGETAEFLISFPEKANYDNKEPVKKAFLNIIQTHVDTLDEVTWGNFEHRAFTGGTVGSGINIHTMEHINFDDERDKITKLSRKDFVAFNLTDSFEVDFYVKSLFKDALEIGGIDNYPVYFNPRGFYFYWNKQTEYLLESWLTFPAYPYGW
ncbi:TPA: hypothetical protein QHT45_004050 [Escherichia coli]|nr:hypothetical protein [Escherichia coli]